MGLNGVLTPVTNFKNNPFTDISSSAGMVPVSGAAGQRWIDNQTAIKSQSGRVRITFNFATNGQVSLRFPAGQFTTGTNSWEPIAKTATNTSFFVRAMLYNSVTGVAIPVTFQGKRTGELSWGWIDSDPVFLGAIAAANRDWYVYCDSYVTTVGDNLPRNRIASTQQDEGFVTHATNLLDTTMPATRSHTANTAVGYAPFVMAVPAAGVRVVCVDGDSRVDCLSDFCALPSTGWENATWYDQAAAARGASVSDCGAASGERLYLQIANGFTLMQKQFAYARSIGATDIIMMTWANDALNGRSTVQIKADLATMKAEWERQIPGVRVWCCTNPPINATSTDLFLTTGNQTIANAGVEVIRIAVNAEIRLGTYGTCIEVADALESARDSGKYKAAVLDGTTYAINTSQTATFARFTTGGALSYGRWRNDLIRWATGVNAGVDKLITNSYYALTATDNRIDWSGSLVQLSGDTFNRWQRYTDGTAAAGSGLHWKTEISQAAVGVVAAASGAFG